MVHDGLEGTWCITKSTEHYGGLVLKAADSAKCAAKVRKKIVGNVLCTRLLTQSFARKVFQLEGSLN